MNEVGHDLFILTLNIFTYFVKVEIRVQDLSFTHLLHKFSTSYYHRYHFVL